MKEFSCGDVIPGCSAHFRGETDDDILRQVGPHAAEAHGITEVSSDIVESIRSKIRTAA